MATFGQFIKQKRVEAKLTQVQVAAHLGYDSQEMISLLENNERYWTLRHIRLAADLFGMQPWELMREWSETLPEST